MFTNIIEDISLFINQEFLTVNFNDFVNPLSLIEQSHRQYEEAIAILNETNNKLTQVKEEQSVIEKNRANVMVEIACTIQKKEDLENKINCLNISLQSIKFDFIKYRQTKTCTDNSETYERIKKIFLTYKNILKIYFDFENVMHPTKQGYLYNIITKKCIYFKFNVEETTTDEIAEYLWNKYMLISNDHNFE